MFDVRRNLMMIDVETTPIEHGKIPETLFWGAADYRGYMRFESTVALVSWLREQEPSLLLHHSNFDIIQLLTDGIIDIEKFNILKSHNNRIIACVLGKHITANTHAMFPCGLSRIMSAYGLTKESLDNLDQRNIDDCVKGLDSVLRLDADFQKVCGVSPIKMGTIASTAFRAAEMYSGKMPKNLGYIEAYRGGRVECFYCGEEEHSKYDINSSYSKSFCCARDTETLLHLRVQSKDWFCPFFDSNTFDMLLFPQGVFETWTFESNMEQYLSTNWKNVDIKVLEKIPIDATWLVKTSELVQKIYRLKQSSSGGIREACKFLLNSMYGRIGLRGDSERARIMSYVPDGNHVTAYQLTWDKWLVFDIISREPRSNFPLAAYITDNARARLYQGVVNTQASYCDTDSAFVRQAELFPNISDEMGAWKYEGRKIFKARNVKDYFWDGAHVLKGGEKSTVWTLKRAAQGKTAIEVERETTGMFRKRIRNDDGTTDPITINYHDPTVNTVA